MIYLFFVYYCFGHILLLISYNNALCNICTICILAKNIIRTWIEGQQSCLSVVSSFEQRAVQKPLLLLFITSFLYRSQPVPCASPFSLFAISPLFFVLQIRSDFSPADTNGTLFSPFSCCLDCSYIKPYQGSCWHTTAANKLITPQSIDSGLKQANFMPQCSQR